MVGCDYYFINKLTPAFYLVEPDKTRWRNIDVRCHMSKILLHSEGSATPTQSWDSSWQEVHEVTEYYYNTKSKEITREIYEEYSNLRQPKNNEKTLKESNVITEGQLPSLAKEKLREVKST